MMDEELNELNTLVAMTGAKLSKDGNKWCWLAGENLQVGLAGFGDTPRQALDEFRAAFYDQSAVPAPAISTSKSRIQTEGLGCDMLDVTISGKPGAGKSHLALWLARMLHNQGMKVILDDARRSTDSIAEVELDRFKTITITTEI